MVVGKVAIIASLILQIVIRYPYKDGTKQGVTDRQEQLALGLLTIGGLLLPFVYIFTGWLSFADYPASPWGVGSGLVMLAAGLWLFWRAHHDLGRNWSSTLEVHADHILVTEGVYHYVRHPMYSANWLMMIGQALVLSNWIAGFGGLVAFAYMYLSRVAKEEQMMLEQFGEPYRNYMAHTGQIVPQRGVSS